MAKTRLMQDPPGLGGTPNGPLPSEFPPEEFANSANSADSSGTNRESEPSSYPIPPVLMPTVEKLDTLWSEFLDQNAVVEQANGQIRALEQNLAQSVAAWQEIRNAVITLQQRLDALARQQVHTNTRMAALQIAAGGNKETPEKVVERAERFYGFLLGDLVTRAQEKQYETSMLNSGDPTQH